MFRFLLLLYCVFMSVNIFPQEKYRYVVYFKDKGDNKDLIYKPELFLSERAIERRKKYKIDIIEQDLPVNKEYIAELSNDFRVIGKSRWFNLAMVEVDSHSDSTILKNYDFVDKIKWVGTYIYEAGNENIYSGDINTSEMPNSYGYMEDFVKINNIDKFHALGFKGNGKLIAVLDDGFCSVDKIKGGWNNNIIGAHDFVDGRDDIVYRIGWHGTRVFSLMAANLEKKYIGTAPEASYLLLRTEYLEAEQPAEEFYWCFAAEYADSIGADIINSSLGYNIYDSDFCSYSHDDLDGNSIISKSADFAARCGIIVVCSAGNEGNKAWKKITVPADARNVLSVGALDKNSSTLVASFSSFGPTADGRVKPDILAPGYIYTINKNGEVEFGNGTSFSSPLVAGAMACLSQALPNVSSLDLIDYVRSTASNFEEPNYRMGYGTADFFAAYMNNGGTSVDYNEFVYSITINSKIYNISSRFELDNNCLISIYSVDGLCAYRGLYGIPICCEGLKNGVYLVTLTSKNGRLSIKIII